MAKKRFVLEFGTGIDLHGEDNTKAACRAVKDAVSRSCLCGLMEIHGIQDLSLPEVEILVACPQPEMVDLERVKNEIPHRHENRQGRRAAAWPPKGFA